MDPSLSGMYACVMYRLMRSPLIEMYPAGGMAGLGSSCGDAPLYSTYTAGLPNCTPTGDAGCFTVWANAAAQYQAAQSAWQNCMGEISSPAGQLVGDPAAGVTLANAAANVYANPMAIGYQQIQQAMPSLNANQITALANAIETYNQPTGSGVSNVNVAGVESMASWATPAMVLAAINAVIGPQGSAWVPVAQVPTQTLPSAPTLAQVAQQVAQALPGASSSQLTQAVQSAFPSAPASTVAAAVQAAAPNAPATVAPVPVYTSPMPTTSQTLAPSSLPPLPASACNASQTYIPPGGRFTIGPMAGQVTSTGACQDPPSLPSAGNPNATPPSSSIFCFPGDSSPQFASIPMCTYTFYGAVALVGLLLFMGKR